MSKVFHLLNVQPRGPSEVLGLTASCQVSLFDSKHPKHLRGLQMLPKLKKNIRLTIVIINDFFLCSLSKTDIYNLGH